jgi:hypothetical protein
MKNILSQPEIAIYGAGSTGIQVSQIIKRNLQFQGRIIFFDSYKKGKVGDSEIQPAESLAKSDIPIIIGVSDYLRADIVNEILVCLKNLSIASERIHLYSEFIEFVQQTDKGEKTWVLSHDSVYDYDTNKLLIEHISRYIDPVTDSIVDLGAGNMNLRKHLSENTRYYPVDYKKRCEETIVCDLNKNEFPNINADTYVLCAMLYYIEKPIELIKKCAEYANRKIIVALHSNNLTDAIQFRAFFGMINYLYFDEITEILKPFGFTPENDIVINDLGRRFVVYSKRC